MFDDLSGKTALVTGASGGLGLHFARLLAGRGVHVVLAARRQAALDQACAQIAALPDGGSARGVRLDVTDAGSVAAVFDGVGTPDIVINNAGVSDARRSLDLEPAEWDRVLDTNLKGCFLVAQSAARAARDAGRGCAIVNIGSITGLRVAGGIAAYAASKAGVIQLSKALALDWARHGVRVNALCPGYIETDINRDFFATEAGRAMIKRIPQRRLGQAGDLDGALLLLCSDAGSYITGASLAVDGGHLVSSL